MQRFLDSKVEMMISMFLKEREEAEAVAVAEVAVVAEVQEVVLRATDNQEEVNLSELMMKLSQACFEQPKFKSTLRNDRKTYK
jgi:hypothetical protein